MRRITLNIIPVLLAFVSLISCTKEAEISLSDSVSMVEKTLYATIVDGELKTVLSGKKTSWVKGDEIAVSDQSACYKFTAQSSGASTSFVGQCGSGKTVFGAVYPYVDGLAVDKTNSSSVVFDACPSTQSVADGSNLPLAALLTDGVLQFKPLAAVFKFTIGNDNGGKFASVRIADNASTAKMSGQAAVNLETGELTPSAASYRPYVVFKPSSGAIPAGTYYLAVYSPGLEKTQTDYAEGLSFYFTTPSGATSKLSSPKAFSTVRGRIYDFGELKPAIPETPVLPETVRILAIGNSFSSDAVEQELYPLLAAAGQKAIIGNMYIGGCPLSKHASNATSDAAAYSYRKIVNGTMTTTESVKLSEAIKDEDWDFISVQEGAGYHGFYDTTYLGTTHSMEPDLTTLLNYIIAKRTNKNCKLIYHAPWAAKSDYTGVKFGYYGYDQEVMYTMIGTATRQVLAAHQEIDLFINTFDAIQNLRSSFVGDNVTRDGWHLNYTTGRYTSGCIWAEKILGRSIEGNSYHPSTISDYLASVCQTAAHEAVLTPYKVTKLSYFTNPDGATTTDSVVIGNEEPWQ